MLRNSLDFQDSELSSAELEGQQFIVLFSAAHIHRTDNQHEGVSFLQALELTIDAATIVEKDSGCVGRISQGSLRVDGTTMKRVPFPYDVEANIELELVFANGSMCKVTGKRIALKTTGESRVVEWLKC